MKIIVINGPNLNMLGIREKGIYGTTGYDQTCAYVRERCLEIGIETDFYQSNCEGELIDCLHRCYFDRYDGVVINPGAYTHYSYAIYDAIKAICLPVVEVHISDIHAREAFRAISVTAPACIAQICGKGIDGYVVAAERLKEYLNGEKF